MPFPPMYFPVYNLHGRLPEPSVHGNPMISTPVMPYIEGLHLVQWLMSDQSKLTTTVIGDGLRFSLRDFDTGGLIPHVPCPPMAGPFLLDTILNSQYVVAFNQPNVKLQGKEVGVFFWLIAPTLRCIELPMPVPPWLAKMAKAGVARAAAKAAEKAAEAVQAASDALAALEYAAEGADAMGTLTPDAAAKNEKQQAEQQKKIDAAKAGQKKKEDKQAAADKFVKDNEDIEWDAKKNQADIKNGDAQPESQEDKQVREFESDMDSKAAKEKEDAALDEKKAADKKARAAQRDADKHDAKAKAALEKGSSDPDAASKEALDHQDQADKKRAEAEEAKKESKAADEKAKAAAKEGSEARKEKSDKDKKRELAKEHKDKHGKSNPYKESTGIGNMSLVFPSLLAHVPFPCTVQIYMSWAVLGTNWLNAVVGMVATALKAYIGLFFDSLGAGRGAIGTYLANLGKAALSGVVDGVKGYITDKKVSFKMSVKSGLLTTSAELTKDTKTGEWTWKASASAAKTTALGEGKIEGSAEGKYKDGDATMDGHSESVSAKSKDTPMGSLGAEGKHSSKTTPATDTTPGKETTTNSASVSGGKVKGSYTDETTTSTDGSSSETQTGKVEAYNSSSSQSQTTTTANDGSSTTTTTNQQTTPIGNQSSTTTTHSPAPVNYNSGAPSVGP